MSKLTLPPADYIQTDEALEAVTQELAQQTHLAIDTESNSLYAYRERVCLFQISTRTTDYIIDPLSIRDMRPLGAVLANPAIEKVFHAAEYDVICIKREYGFEVRNIFDTMIAARVCGIDLIGLGNLLEMFFDIHLDKRHQRDNWGKRPLPRASLLYAQMDTHYLLQLRDRLHERLASAGRLAEAWESFDELHYVEPGENGFDPDGYWRIGRSHDLSRRQMAILRELYLWREEVARQRDYPPFKIISNAAMIDLALEAPRSRAHLSAVRGMSPLVIRRHGAAILEAIRMGNQARLPQPPRQPAPIPPDVMERYTALREWRKLRASERGVDSDVIISKNVLWTLAEQAPRTLDDMQGIPGLGPWRLSRYGDELLKVLHPL